MNNENVSYVDFDQKYSYPLQWLYESQTARWAYQRWIWRSSLAKQGKPCENVYQKELTTNLKKADPTTQRKYEERCKQVPEGRSFALRRAQSSQKAEQWKL